MVFVISASFRPVTSNLSSYVTGIGFQFIVASLGFFYFHSETGPLGSEIEKLKARGNTILPSLLLVPWQTKST